MLEPSRRTSPRCQCLLTLSFMRLRERRNVVLPEPVGPIRAVIWPLTMSTFMSDRTVADPKPRARSRTSIAVATFSTLTVALSASTVRTFSDGAGEGVVVLITSTNKLQTAVRSSHSEETLGQSLERVVNRRQQLNPYAMNSAQVQRSA